MNKQLFFKTVSIFLIAVMTVMLFAGCKDKNQASVSDYSSGEGLSTLENDQSGDLDDNSSKSTSSNKKKSTSSSNGSSKLSKQQAQQIISEINVNGQTCTMLSPFYSNDPAIKSTVDNYKKFCNGKLKLIGAPYDQVSQKLAAMCMANNAPDIYFVNVLDFPSIMYKNLFQDLDGILDLSSNEWDSIRGSIEQFKWQGKHYVLGTYSTPPRGLWFNRKVMEDFGVAQDPYSLFTSNQWSWDTMLNIAKQTTDTANGKYGLCDGTSLIYELFAGVKQDIISITPNGAVNNVENGDIARAMNFYSDLFNKYQVMSPSGEEGATLFKEGKVAMYYGLIAMSKADPYKTLLQNGTITFVPFPSPNAGSYSPHIDAVGYAIPNGAKHVDAAKAFMRMQRVEEGYRDQQFKSECLANNWGDQEIQVVKQLYSYTGSSSFSGGIPDASSAFVKSLIEVSKGTAWSTQIKQCSPKIQQAIDQLNASNK